MDAAERGPHAEMPLDELDAFVQITAAEQHVVEDLRHSGRARAPRTKRRAPATARNDRREIRDMGRSSRHLTMIAGAAISVR